MIFISGNINLIGKKRGGLWWAALKGKCYWHDHDTNSDLAVAKAELGVKQRWLSMGVGITELYGDSSYHPYVILIANNFVYISGNFVVPTDIAATTTVLSNLIPPVKMRWLPIYNMTTKIMYYAYIATGDSNLTINNLPKGNYSINFGYQHAYGAGI